MPDIDPVLPSDALPLLGKKAAKMLRGLPALGKYTLTLPSSPPAANYSLKIAQLGNMGNDKLGDCTCAAVGHAIQTWTSLTQPTETVISDQQIIELYSAACGYVPGDQYTDQGGVASEVLRYWYNHPIDGHHALSGFAGIRPGNRATTRDAIYLFGVAYIGIQLPLAAQKDIWDVSPDIALTGEHAPGSWGGHAIPLVAYDQDSLTCITWGKLKTMSWSFLDAYMDEGYGLLSKDWIDSSGHAPPGFDFDQLSLDMQSIRAGG